MYLILIGGISACFASAVIHPIDLAKVRLQLWEGSTKKPSFLTIIYSIGRGEGIKALYAGLSAALMRQGCSFPQYRENFIFYINLYI
jgi:hypothetical protein